MFDHLGVAGEVDKQLDCLDTDDSVADVEQIVQLLYCTCVLAMVGGCGGQVGQWL